MKKKEILFTVITWVIVLTAINQICGLIVKNKYIAVDPISQKTASASFGYFRPNQDKIILFPGKDNYQVKINALGLRSVGGDDDISVAALFDQYKVLAVGDSVTFGLFVDDKDTYPYRLQRIFEEEHKNAIALNAGVGSTTISDHLYYIKNIGMKLKPDLVVVNFCVNDLTELSREQPFYEKIRDENVFELGKEIKLANFMRVFREMELAARYRRSLGKINDERAKQILSQNSTALDDILYLSGFHAGNLVLDPKDPALEESWKKYFAVLDELADYLNSEKVEFLLIIHPDIVNVFDAAKSNYQDILRAHLDRNKIAYIDLLKPFKEDKDNYMQLYNDLPRDYHLAGDGNEIVAREIYARIKDKI